MLTEIKDVIAETYRAEIFIAGDYAEAVRACREFVMRGACVSVSPADYVYTGGMESGVRVLIINYPRFPKPDVELSALAIELAGFLIVRLFQSSATVVTDQGSVWLTRRDE